MPKLKRGTKRKIPNVVDTRDEHWIGFQEKIPGRYRHLVNNPNLSDMSFVVGAQRVIIHGHKLIVGISSSVLHSQMQSMNPFDPEIVIPDITSEIWLKVLQFMYGHPIDTMLTPENILGCLKCARRYKLKILRDKCAYFIRSNGLLLNDDIPVHMLNSVTITEAIELRRDVRSSDSTSVITIQWRSPVVLSIQGVGSKEVRRLMVTNLRNLEASYMFNNIIAWFRSECEMHKMPRDHLTLSQFLLRRCPRLNFPAMTPGQFFSCVNACSEILLSQSEIQKIKADARQKRRKAIEERRKLPEPGQFSGISTQSPKSGIFEVPFLQNFREIQMPQTRDYLNRTTITFTTNKLVIAHGFAVPVIKGEEAAMTVVFISNNARLLEKSISSGMRRLYNTKHEFLYLFLRDPVLLEPGREYKISIRAYDGACSLIGDFYREISVNDIKFVFHLFHQPYSHALFMLFEDPEMSVEATALSMMDLVSFVRRPSSNPLLDEQLLKEEEEEAKRRV